ncbi:MAG: hypothetical protein L3J16_05950, partial [Anaerolineales bacterium]|nr:hypothetical protein [Anaerolineales bacterium]
MSVEFVLRLVGMIGFTIWGASYGNSLSRLYPEVPMLYTIVLGLVGALAGLILTPYFTTRPIRAIRSVLGRIAAETLFAALVGLVSGLLIAALLAFPLSLLPGLLDTLAVNAHREYPQLVFEVGEVTVLDAQAETGAREGLRVAAALIGPKMGATEARAAAEALLREFCLGIRTENAALPTFLP